MWTEPGGVPNPSSLCCRLPATTNVSNYTRGMQQMRCRVISCQKSLSHCLLPWSHKALCLLLGAPATLLSPLLPHTTSTLRPLPVALKILISPRSGGSQGAGSKPSSPCCAHRTPSVVPKDLLLPPSLGGWEGCHISGNAE